METLDWKIRKGAILSGILYGIITLILTIFLFYFITGMTRSMWMIAIIGPLTFSFLLPLAVAIFFCIDLRKKIGGFWSYRQATTGIFIMFFVGYLVSYTGNLAFSKLIEPDMVEKMKTVFVNTTTEMLEKQKTEQDKIDKKITEIEANFDSQKTMTAGTIAKGFGIAIIFDFVIALIFAAFFKREPLLLAEDGEAYRETVA